MSRKERLKQHHLVSSASGGPGEALAVSYQTPATSGRNLDNLRYTVDWANGAAADFDITLQFAYALSDNEESIGNKIDNADNASWVDVDIATVNPNISGANGQHIIDVAEFPNRFVRLNFTRNGGQIDLDVYVEGKSKGA